MKIKFLAIIISAFIFTLGCQPSETVETAQDEKGMIKVTILYPSGDGNTFDMDYYSTSHMPMVAEELGEAMKYYEIDKGISGRTPDDEIPYLAIGYLYFESLSAYRQAFGPKAGKITSDIPNYTNIQPTIQISEVQ